MRAFVFIAALLIALPSFAREVQLYGDYGCELYAIQLQRLDLMETISLNMQAKGKGLETADSKRKADAAVKEMVSVSNTSCRPLKGRFKVLEVRPAGGGNALRVQLPKDRYLWVLQ